MAYLSRRSLFAALLPALALPSFGKHEAEASAPTNCRVCKGSIVWPSIEVVTGKGTATHNSLAPFSYCRDCKIVYYAGGAR